MASCSNCKQDRKMKAVTSSLKEDANAIQSPFARLCNTEILLGGHHTVTEADVCVWPPVLVGKRDMSTLEELHDDSLSIGASCLRNLISDELKAIDKRGIAEIINYKLCCRAVGNPKNNRSLYIFPTESVPESVEGYLAARHIDREWSKKNTEGIKRLTNAGWTLKYARARDMAEIDPHRKLVDWIPLCSSKEHDLMGLSCKEKIAKMNKIDMPQCPPRRSLCFSEELKRKIRDISISEMCFKGMMVAEADDRCSHKLIAMLKQDFMKPIEIFLEEAFERESELGNLFTFDGAHVAKTSTERLDTLGVMISEENSQETFTSRMINRGVEMELDILQSVDKEIREANALLKTLKYFENEHVMKSAQILIEKQKTEMLELLTTSWAKLQFISEARMESRLKLVKSIRRTEEEVSILTTILSVGTSEIIEQVHKDALQDQDQQHAHDKENLEQKFKSANEELIAVHKNEVATLSASLKDIKEAKPNQECCICYHELQGFSVPSGHGESSSAKKLHKRACFLPCMHANVCSTCSEKRWSEGPRLCPICRQKLTRKPRVIYL